MPKRNNANPIGPLIREKDTRRQVGAKVMQGAFVHANDWFTVVEGAGE